jgi:hypothetical protein
MFGGQAQYEEVDSLILPLAHRRVVKLKRGRKKSAKRMPMLTVRSGACFFIIKRQKKRDKKYVAPSTNVNNTLDFNNTAIVWKPSPAADLLLIELDPCRVPAFEPIIDQSAFLDPNEAETSKSPPWPPGPGEIGTFKLPPRPPDPAGVGIFLKKAPPWNPDPGEAPAAGACGFLKKKKREKKHPDRDSNHESVDSHSMPEPLGHGALMKLERDWVIQ